MAIGSKPYINHWLSEKEQEITEVREKTCSLLEEACRPSGPS